MTPRPLLDRLYDLEHALKTDGWRHFAKDMREGIEELERLYKLTATVDVKVKDGKPKASA